MNKLIYQVYLVVFSVTCAGGIINGSFELFDPNGTEWFDPPLDWTYENYAAVTSEYNASSNVTWSIPAAPDGMYFCLLSTGDMGTDGSREITRSSITQKVVLNPGDTLRGSYFFGTCDWSPYVDVSRIYLYASDPNTDPNEIDLAYVTVTDVGNYRAMEDWDTFSYTYDGPQTREFSLICEVEDVGDSIVNSYLAVDAFSICKVSRARGDLNEDCQVNLEDFSMLAKSWFSECDPSHVIDPNLYDPNIPVDPNWLYDPNSPCVFSDIDGNYLIDLGDLQVLMDWWLFPLF